MAAFWSKSVQMNIRFCTFTAGRLSVCYFFCWLVTYLAEECLGGEVAIPEGGEGLYSIPHTLHQQYPAF
jgi:hypothetical protein